jgi:L,D-peptidoglycan transpeptidase YkuD (ErfK/YbiS/YcfS/YnhG family)
VAVALLSSCGSGGAARFDVASVADSNTTSTMETPATTTSTRVAPRPAKPTATTARVKAPSDPYARLKNVKGDQAIVVTASRYGATTAQFTAFERIASGWRTAFGPWSAYVGRKGVAPPGAKREGDGRTPSGTYGFDFFFGVQPDPGVKFPYRVVTGPNIVWVEDPASPNYNRWVDKNTEDVGNQSDSMYKQPVYNYGAVVNYNTAARTPGLGSGIFIHVSRNAPSAGCITLPVDQLLSVLRWLDPAASPSVVIGVG